MIAARYWRLVGFSTLDGSNLSLSEVELRQGGTRVDDSATLTSSHTPVSGTLAALSDDDLGTTCTFSAAQYRTGGFFLMWDFGADQIIDDLRLGAGASAATFPYGFSLEYKAGSVWVTHVRSAGVIFPGANTLTTSAAGTLAPTTWNPADKGSLVSLTNDDLTATGILTNGSVRSVVGVASGKWYWEVASTGGRYPIIGVATGSASLAAEPGGDASGWAFYGLIAKKIHAGVYTDYGTVWSSAAHVIGLALDMDAGTLSFYNNGVDMGVAFTGISGTVYAITGGDTDSATANATANFGGAAFSHTPPGGFQSGLGIAKPSSPQTAAPRTETVGMGWSALFREDLSDEVRVFRGNFPRTVRDIYLAGRGSIAATVKEDGTPTDTPVRRKVRLFRDRDGLMVRETWSNATTGAYTFTEIDENETYSVVSYDHNNNFRAVIADRITPTVA